MYQEGCLEDSAWGTFVVEAGTELSLNLNGAHTFQCIKKAVGKPQPRNLFLWRLELSFRKTGVHTFHCTREAVGRPQHGEPLLWRLGLSFRSILFKVSGRLWGGLSLGICPSGGWN